MPKNEKIFQVDTCFSCENANAGGCGGGQTFCVPRNKIVRLDFYCRKYIRTRRLPRSMPYPNGDEVLAELRRGIGKHITPVGFGGKKMLHDIFNQIDQIEKKYAFLNNPGE